MKQHITKKQWDEITLEQQKIIDKSVGHIICQFDNRTGDFLYPLNIGQMIEFLGEEYLIAPEDKQDGFFYSLVWDKDKELCDELWDAVKLKLINNN